MKKKLVAKKKKDKKKITIKDLNQLKNKKGGLLATRVDQEDDTYHGKFVNESD